MPIIHSLARTAVLTGLLLLTKGCTALLPDRALELPETVGACQAFLARIDRTVKADGATDGASFQIDGFPYLRTNRFLTALEAKLITRDQIQAWLTAMHTLDLEARRKEIRNLSKWRLERLAADGPASGQRETLLGQAEQCSQTLFAHHRYETDLRARLRAEIAIPDEYQTWRRLVGLYPLASLPVALITDNVFDEFRQWHATAPEDLPVSGRLVNMVPEDEPGPKPFDPRTLFQPPQLDALGIVQLTVKQGRQLAAHYAPVITQDTRDEFDRIGTLVWRNGRVQVAVEQATVYYYFSFALLAGRPVLQINYTIWYPRRDGPNAPWIERGPLDGITLRISIDHQARPFMVDLMNSCGCYHFFIPERAAVRAVRKITLEVDPLVPGWMPPDFPEQRLRLQVNAGWHQVQHVGTAPLSTTGQVYRLEPYEKLETLPNEAGQSRSMFDADGIAHNSERIEPLIFFSMGIPSVGSMRQRGRHAIRFVGRAYFDDPLLFEESFEFNWDHFGFNADRDPETRP